MPFLFFFFFQDKSDQTPKDITGEIDINPATIIEKIDNSIDAFVKLLPNLVLGLIFLIVFYFVAKWIGKLVNRGLKRQDRSNFGQILGGFVRWTIFLSGIGFTLTIVSPNLRFADLVAGLGISSVAIGFAFKDILQNWLAGLLILLRQPFQIGDEITVNGITGRVERIETRATLIMRYDGQRVVIPNSEIYTKSIRVITSKDYIRSQYDIGVGYDQDYEKAIKILEETLAKIDSINKEKPIDVLPWDQADSWLNIRLRWWTESDRSTVIHTFSEVILSTQQAMNEGGIDLPFPTHVEIQNAHDIKEAQDFYHKMQRKDNQQN